jgi:PAS domain S-box-containing protein
VGVHAPSIEREPAGLAGEAGWTPGVPLEASASRRLRARLGPFARAGLALALVAVALALRYLLVAFFGEVVPFVTFFPAVMLAAVVLGRLGGVVASVGAGVAAWLVVIGPGVPARAAAAPALVNLGVFLAMGLLVTALAHRSHRAQERAAAAERERDLRVGEVTLRSVAEAVIAADRDGRVTLLNRAAVELTGWAAAEALGQPVERVVRLVDEETRAAVPCPVERARRTEAAVGSAGRRSVLVDRSGRERAVSESASPIRDPSGAITGVVVVLRDEAAERGAARLMRARLALHEYAPSHTLEETLRRTVDEACALTGSPIGFYHFVEADQRTLSLQTWSTRTVREFCTARGAGLHYPADVAGVWGDALRERRPVVHNDYPALPHRHGLPEGHVPVVRELVVPVLRDDRVVALVGVGNKPVEYAPGDVEAVAYLADACWETVARKRAEETRDQLELQLRQAQKLESIGRLAGGIAHDFNNLLTVILSCARGAEEAQRAGEPVDREDLEEIRRAGERARDLTRRLLLFARKQSADPVAIDMNGVVRSVEGLLRRVLGDDIELRVDLQSTLWPVLFDPGLLEQVLLNFAVNARDAMPEGGTLLIGTRNATVDPGQRDRGPEDLPGDWVRISVRDTGIGMTADARAHLFEPFFTTKEVGKGTGLGLAMVHGIVSQAGGHVHVETEPGRGTMFEVCVPRAARDVVAPEGVSAEASAAARGSETVLVVEDEAVVRIVVVRALQDAGYTVLEASGPTDALELFREEPRRIDLVVTDVRMLGQSGPSMAKVMRRLRPDVRVLYVSGFPGDQAELAAGDGFLAKPFSREALRAQVRSILDRGGAAPPA